MATRTVWVKRRNRPCSYIQSTIGSAGTDADSVVVALDDTAAVSATVARRRMLGFSNTIRGVIITSCLRAAFTSEIATILSIPRAKKSSSIPGRTPSSRSANTVLNTCSLVVCGAVSPTVANADSARQSRSATSSLPFTVIGNVGNPTMRAGNI